MSFIAATGRRTLGAVSGLGRFFIFFLQQFRAGTILKRPKLVIEQVHFIGVLSLLIIAVSGLFVGFVLAFQGYHILSNYGSEEALGMMVALALLRELGPVVTALLFAGRAGTSITAQIGLMKAGEQLDAIDVMGVSPIKRIIVPRFWGGVIAMPILAAIFSAIGVFGGWIVGVVLISVDPGAFWSQMQSGVDVLDDLLNGVLKSVVFGIACMLVALYQGWVCDPTPQGVSRATTRTVVISSLLVLGLDFVLTALMFK